MESNHPFFAIRFFRLKGFTLAIFLLELGLQTNLQAYVGFQIGPKEHGLLYTIDGYVHFQPCAELRPDPVFQRTLDEAIDQCRGSVRAFSAELFQETELKISVSEFSSSLLALLSLPTPSSGAGLDLEQALSSEVLLDERALRQGGQADLSSSQARLEVLFLVQSILENIADRNQFFDAERSLEMHELGDRFLGAFSPTFSNGKVSLKLESSAHASSLQEACPKGWVPTSLLTLMASGQDGIDDKTTLLAWLNHQRAKDNSFGSPSKFSVLTWQLWFDPKTATNGVPAWERHDDTFLIEYTPETVEWMVQQQEVIRAILDSPRTGAPISLGSIPAIGKPFRKVPADASGAALCLKRFFPRNISPEPVDQSGDETQLELEWLYSRYSITPFELQKIASLYATLDAALSPYLFLRPSCHAPITNQQSAKRLDPLVGFGLTDLLEVEHNARAARLMTLLNEVKPAPEPTRITPSRDGSSLGLGSSIRKSLSAPGEEHRHAVYIETAGRYVFETTENPSITMFLELQDQQGNSLSSNHHGGRRLLNARIEIFLQPGRYTLLARHFFSTASSVGTYHLEVNQALN